MMPNRAAVLAAGLAMLAEAQRNDEPAMAIKFEPERDAMPEVKIMDDGFDDMMGGPSRAKPSKTYHVPGGGAKERARRLAKMQQES